MRSYARRGCHLDRSACWRLVDRLSEEQAGALSRWQLVRAGVPRWFVTAQLKARRWQTYGKQVVITHNGPVLLARTVRWAALLCVGGRAAIDGVSALQEAGVTGLSDTDVHVITPKGSTPNRPSWVRLHESRRYREEDVLCGSIRRVRPAVAAVHAALWARTDREATYVLMLVVQQRVVSVGRLAEAVGVIRRHPRLHLLQQVVRDLAGGIQSLGELDVARDMRARGLPEPTRQVVRQRPDGRDYLDCELEEFGLHLELDGAGHDDPFQRLEDLLRDLHSAAEGSTAIRVPLVAYRLGKDRVLDALEALLVARGWVRSAPLAA